MESLAFTKGGSAAFLVMSPFQLICALEAAYAFNIDDVFFEFIFVKDYEYRNAQMEHMAKMYEVPYRVRYTDDINIDSLYGKSKEMPIKEVRLFDRIFIGDHCSKHLHVEAYKYSRPGSYILYLDDGTSTICFLKGISANCKLNNWVEKYNHFKYKRGTSNLNRRIKKKFARNDVFLTNCFFTMYEKVRTKRFHLYPNDFCRLRSEKNIKERIPVIYVIGTVINEFSSTVLSEKESALEAIIWQKLSIIRESYPNDKIIYIPHPRDLNLNISGFCRLLNIEYLRLEESVESYIIHNPYHIKSIWGFGSTSLGVLKKLFADAEIVNISIFNGNNSCAYDAIYDYYAMMGIRIDTVELKQDYKRSFFSDFVNNMISFTSFIFSKIQKRIN